jgi:hypothetical protein
MSKKSLLKQIDVAITSNRTSEVQRRLLLEIKEELILSSNKKQCFDIAKRIIEIIGVIGIYHLGA